MPADVNQQEQEEFEFRLRLEQEQGGPEPPAPRRTPREMSVREQAEMALKPSTWRALTWGVPEAIANVGSKMIGAPIAIGAGGVGAAVGESPYAGQEYMAKAQDMLTYQPRSPAGRMLSDIANWPAEQLGKIPPWAGRRVTDVTGSPLAGAITEGTLQTAPLLLGGKAATAAERPGPRIEPVIGERPPAMLRYRDQRVPLASIQKVSEPPRTTRQRALDAGYKLTMTDLDRGVILRGVEGLAGYAKQEKLNSMKNQATTDRLMAEDLGLPTSRKLTSEDFSAARAKEGEAYERVKSAAKLIKPDRQFLEDISAARGDYSAAAKEYPGLLKNDAVEQLVQQVQGAKSPRAMVELTRKLRSDASKNLKAFDDPGKIELGFAQRNVSNAIEELIDRALSSVGKTDLVRDWQAARVRIAKLHDAESAFNESAQSFSGPQLARMQQKGRPFTGKMKLVADTASDFGGSMREPWKMRDKAEFSYGDIVLGSIAGAGGYASSSGMAAGLGGVGLVTRPAVRHLLTTRPMQREAISLADLKKMGLAGGQAAKAPLAMTSAIGLRAPVEEE